MSWIEGFRTRLRQLVHRGEAEARVRQEFRFHLEMEIEKNRRSGMGAVEARRAAVLAFGSEESHRETMREGWRAPVLEELVQELRHAARSLRRTPGFTLAAVLMLALGVGVNASVFGLVSALFLRPLPFGNPDRLTAVFQTYVEAGGSPVETRWSYPEYRALGPDLSTLKLAAYNAADANLSGAVMPERVRGEVVTASYFRVLRIDPAAGRFFLPAEDSLPGAAPVVVLSHALWQRDFASGRSILGSRVSLNGVMLTVVGVAPAGFTGLTGDAGWWIPQAMAPSVTFPEQLESSQRFLSVVGRLSNGATLARARSEVASREAALEAVRRDAAAEEPGEWAASLIPLALARRAPATVRARLVLAGAVFFVLLIACVNLSGLVLARSSGRARERAVRAALGAGRARLVRHGLMETVLLGLMAAVVSLAIAVPCVRLLRVVAPAVLGRPGSRSGWDIESFAAPVVDWRVVAFGAVLALGAAVLSGLVPALRGARDPEGGLRSGARGSTVGVGTLRRPTFLAAVAVLQVTAALVLLAGAGHLLEAYRQLRSVDPGFDAAGLLTFRLSAPYREYEGPAAASLIERVLERVETVPGVVSASVSLCPPLRRCSWTSLFIPGRTENGDPPTVGRYYVGPDHFRTLRVPLLRGRSLTAQDRAGRPRVAVINETAARRFWPGQDPIGEHVWFGSGGGFADPDSATEIVGIVGDVLYGRPGDPIEPDFYTSYLQFTWPETTVLVRTSADGTALAPSLARAVAAVDPDLPIFEVRTMAERSDASLAGERFATWTVGAFAGLGLVLAALGVYGVMAYTVAQRRREIGIRMALGAAPGAVLRLVIGNGLALATAGSLAGVLVALALTRVLSALVAGSGAPRPLVLAIAVPLLLFVTLLTCYLPARGAARIDPTETISAD